VIVPVYRAGRYLPRLAASLIDQGAQQVIVVIDDDSPTAEVEAVLAGVENLRIVRSAGATGAGAARNLGAGSATQPWLAFLDADDWWEPGFLASLVAAGASDVVAYDCRIWREEGEEVVQLGETIFGKAGWTRGGVGRDDSSFLLDGFPIQKMLLRREVFESIGGFRPLAAVQDFDLAWRLVASGQTIEMLRAPAGEYLVRADSITDRVRTDRRAFERAQRCWARIWFDMARERRLPGPVRRACARRAVKVVARMPARRVKNALRGARRLISARRD
jgi:glycosyltransferase involved in cell wall biosynthesis